MRELTREEVLAMEPGRELDALVAMKVFGHQINWEVDEYLDDIPVDERGFYVDFFSTNIADAWDVVENLQKRGMFLNIETYRGSFAARVLRVPGPELGYSMEVETAPVAICKAALLAVLEVS